MIERLAITVTEDHIARGIRRDGNSCPIALALSEAIGASVTVDADCIEIDHGASYRGEEIEAGTYETTGDISDFVEDYDNDREVAPITFAFELFPTHEFRDDEDPPGEETPL